METEKSLTEMVKEKLREQELVRVSSIFTKEVLEALRLSELYSVNQRRDYVVPLNAMAGFRVATQKGRD